MSHAIHANLSQCQFIDLSKDRSQSWHLCLLFWSFSGLKTTPLLISVCLLINKIYIPSWFLSLTEWLALKRLIQLQKPTSAVVLQKDRELTFRQFKMHFVRSDSFLFSLQGIRHWQSVKYYCFASKQWSSQLIIALWLFEFRAYHNQAIYYFKCLIR